LRFHIVARVCICFKCLCKIMNGSPHIIYCTNGVWVYKINVRFVREAILKNTAMQARLRVDTTTCGLRIMKVGVVKIFV